jgi:hypothetical protein
VARSARARSRAFEHNIEAVGTQWLAALTLRFWTFGTLIVLVGHCELGCSSNARAVLQGVGGDASVDGPEKLPSIELTLWRHGRAVRLEDHAFATARTGSA